MGVPSKRPKRSVTTSGTPPRPVLLGVAHGVEDAHVGGGNLEVEFGVLFATSSPVRRDPTEVCYRPVAGLVEGPTEP
jgi:hypothetical protein